MAIEEIQNGQPAEEIARIEIVRKADGNCTLNFQGFADTDPIMAWGLLMLGLHHVGQKLGAGRQQPALVPGGFLPRFPNGIKRG